MKAGPCRYCGLPVEIDDNYLGHMWTSAIHDTERTLNAKVPALSKEQIAAELSEMQEAILRKGAELAPHVNHQHCIDKFKDQAQVRKRTKERDNRTARYYRACPFGATTVFDDIPFRARNDVLTAFTISRQSVTLMSETRRGKSRLAWILLFEPFINGQDVMAFTHTSLKYSLYTKARRSQADLSAWIAEIERCDVLLIDDLGKADMVKGEIGMQVEEATFHILDQRLGREGRRTILTTNDDFASMIQRMTPDRGAPLAGRIRELTARFTG